MGCSSDLSQIKSCHFLPPTPYDPHIQACQPDQLTLGGELIYPKLPKTKETQCYQTFSGAVLYIKAGENFEFGER